MGREAGTALQITVGGGDCGGLKAAGYDCGYDCGGDCGGLKAAGYGWAWGHDVRSTRSGPMRVSLKLRCR